MSSLTTALQQSRPFLFLALLAFLLHVTANALGFYDYFRDEFYYIACSDHLAWGYVDHPPLSIFLLWITQLFLGDSLFAIRLLPAIASAGLVFLTGTITREVGGNARSQFLASLAVLIAPIYLVLCDFYSMNGFEPLFWMGAVLIFIRIVKTENQKLWLAFGALAALIALPNVIWQATHGWPALEFSRNATQFKNAPMSPVEFFFMQAIFQNPLTFPIWFIGLGALFLHKDLKAYRLFGIAYIFLFALFVLQRGKPYYLSRGPKLPIEERWARTKGYR